MAVVGFGPPSSEEMRGCSGQRQNEYFELFFINSNFFPDFRRNFLEILQTVYTSPHILTLSAKISQNIIPQNFNQNQAEKAVFLFGE